MEMASNKENKRDLKQVNSVNEKPSVTTASFKQNIPLTGKKFTKIYNYKFKSFYFTLIYLHPHVFKSVFRVPNMYNY